MIDWPPATYPRNEFWALPYWYFREKFQKISEKSLNNIWLSIHLPPILKMKVWAFICWYFREFLQIFRKIHWILFDWLTTLHWHWGWDISISLILLCRIIQVNSPKNPPPSQKKSEKNQKKSEKTTGSYLID